MFFIVHIITGFCWPGEILFSFTSKIYSLTTDCLLISCIDSSFVLVPSLFPSSPCALPSEDKLMTSSSLEGRLKLVQALLGEKGKYSGSGTNSKKIEQIPQYYCCMRINLQIWPKYSVHAVLYESVVYES